MRWFYTLLSAECIEMYTFPFTTVNIRISQTLWHCHFHTCAHSFDSVSPCVWCREKDGENTKSVYQPIDQQEIKHPSPSADASQIIPESLHSISKLWYYVKHTHTHAQVVTWKNSLIFPLMWTLAGRAVFVSHHHNNCLVEHLGKKKKGGSQSEFLSLSWTLRWLRAAAGSSQRCVSVCLGVCVCWISEAGVLQMTQRKPGEKRGCVWHWEGAERDG